MTNLLILIVQTNQPDKPPFTVYTWEDGSYANNPDQPQKHTCPTGSSSRAQYVKLPGDKPKPVIVKMEADDDDYSLIGCENLFYVFVLEIVCFVKKVFVN